MYLEREVYIGNPRTATVENVDFNGYNKSLEFDKNKISSFKTEVGYWRKANAIHSWFVKNVQNGVDDCGSYVVSHEKMIELYESCSKAYLKKDSSEFEPTEGFFFGGTEIDEYYWRDILETMRMIEPIVKELKKPFEDRDDITKASDFYYMASW